MALRPDQVAVGQVELGDAGFPFGKAKNVSAPGAADGTPVVAEFWNDLWGLLQSLLKHPAYATDPDGNVDRVGSSQYLAAIEAIAAAIFTARAGELAGLNQNQVQALINTAVTALIDGAPANRNTLAELSDAIDALDAGGQLPSYAQATTEALFSRAGNLFWEIVNEVPDTPGEQSAIGHVLQVNGTGDRDYRWGALDIAAAVSAYLMANPPSGGGGGASVFFGVSTDIPDTADGDTYIHNGANAATASLPAASGAGEVDDGWTVTVSNQGVGILTIDPAGADTINGAATLDMGSSRTIRVRKVAASAWITIADTKDETGGTGVIADGSLGPIKTDATDGPKRKAWRARFGSVSLTAGANLPAAADANERDLHYFPQDVAAGGSLSWRDVLDADTVIDTAQAGDVGLYNARTGWIRIGNFIAGSPALRALITALTERVDANTELLARMSVFEHYEFNPGGIPGTDFPEFIALKCARKIVNKTVQSIAVSLGGQNVGNIVRNVNPVPPATDPAVPFNNGVSELSGGIVNCVLNVQARQNLKNSVGVANGSPQFIGANVTVTFTDGTVMSDLLHFGTNNNAYRGGDVDQTARDAAAAAQATADDATTPGEASEIANGRVSALRAIITNIASFDAAQNRFEDGDGDEVAIPDGADVYLTQAVYDAAVADAEFTPNANATFYTRA